MCRYIQQPDADFVYFGISKGFKVLKVLKVFKVFRVLKDLSSCFAQKTAAPESTAVGIVVR